MAQVVLFIKNNILEFISITPHLCDIKVLPTQSYRYWVSITLVSTQCAVVFVIHTQSWHQHRLMHTYTHIHTEPLRNVSTFWNVRLFSNTKYLKHSVKTLKGIFWSLTFLLLNFQFWNMRCVTSAVKPHSKSARIFPETKRHSNSHQPLRQQ